MERCVGRQHALVEQSIATTISALDQAKVDVLALKQKNGRAAKTARAKLKMTIANNLRRLRRESATAARQALLIDTDELDEKIESYKLFFDEHFPNSAQMPKPEHPLRRPCFNRHAPAQLTPCWHMGPPK